MYRSAPLLCSVILVFLGYVNLLENGLARTPPMGWMSWGYYMCGDNCRQTPKKCLDENLITSVADAFLKEGFQEAGFQYIVIDDCWAQTIRNRQGKLAPNRARFPNGMKYLADYIHARDLKFGMYTNIADVTCMQYPGSKGHFETDISTFAEWGVDYIKVDGCFASERELDTAFIEIGHHLEEIGRPMVYSCSWPYYKYFEHKRQIPNHTAVAETCNLWRNYLDVQPHWKSVKNIINFFQYNYHWMHQHHGPGHWNDPDMLKLGTGILTPAQARIQLSVYLMLSAPIFISCPMDRLTAYEKSLLTNLELMAIGKDPLGIMAKPYRLSENLTMWVKRHLPAKGDMYYTWSLAFVNLDNENPQHAAASLVDLGLNCSDGYTVMDKFSQQFIRNITLEETLMVVVPAEDVILYTLFAL